MRSKELKIGGEKREAVLVAGGNGFKVYTISGMNGWALAFGRSINFIEDKSPDAKTVARYVNLRYQPVDLQGSILSEFKQLVDKFNSNGKNRNFESAL